MRISDWSSDVCSSDPSWLPCIPRAPTIRDPLVPGPFMIAVQDRLIVALDVPTAADARQLVATLGDAASFYKIGMELLMAPGFFELLASLKADGKKEIGRAHV